MNCNSWKWEKENRREDTEGCYDLCWAKDVPSSTICCEWLIDNYINLQQKFLT